MKIQNNNEDCALIIHTPSASYPIIFGELKPLVYAHKVLIVSNPTIAHLYLDKVRSLVQAPQVEVHLIPDGEEYKNMQELESLLETAFRHHLDRKSLFIALGGGVIGDMVGFGSGIYQRGVDFIQIPTTLLSQVDASVGGKCGINNTFGKNLIGLFHQPRAVYINPHFLLTLPKREFAAGMAEIIKMAVCFHKDLFTYLQTIHLSTKDLSTLQEVIRASVEIKVDVVSADEKEQGIRAGLNYGHTFGHVIERLTHYKQFLHGEAVSIGMVMANALACRLGLLKEEEAKSIRLLLDSYGLPTYFKIDDVRAFYNLFFLDKKSADSRVMFVLPRGIGAVEMRRDIEQEVVEEVLESFTC